MRHMPSGCQRFRSRAEWLKARANSIGGSDLALILGKAKFGTLDDLYDRLTGKPQKEETVTDRMVEGTLTESSIRTLFSFDFKKEYEVTNPPRNGNWLWKNPAYPFVHCSPDGILRDRKTKEFGGLEIKNVELAKTEDIELWNSNRLPDQYFWQCVQYLLAIPDLQFVVLYAHLKYFAKYGEEWKFDHAEDRAYLIRREEPTTDKALAIALANEAVFMKRYVKAGKRPPLTIKL